jgi:hypothetical protein
MVYSEGGRGSRQMHLTATERLGRGGEQKALAV